MRTWMIGLGLVAILVAAVLAMRDNTAQVTASATGAARPTVSKEQPISTQVPTLTAVADLFFVHSADSLAAYDTATARPRFTLPPQGVLSADGKHYYVAHLDSSSSTLVTGFDPATGKLMQRTTLADQWAVGAVSPSGQWLALRRIAGNAEQRDWLETRKWQTQIKIVVASNGAVVHSLNLDGNFDVDAISEDGTALFLIEHPGPVGSLEYSVRLYELAQNMLVPGAIVEKGETEQMVGSPWSRVAAPDGSWLFTLYLNTADKSAFVHALNLQGRFAVCFDLPSTGSLEQLKDYALALSPDGQTLYAANAALGSIAPIDISQLHLDQPVEFTPLKAAASPTATAYETDGRGLVSPDGQNVYFAAGDSVWTYNTNTGQVTGPYSTGRPILGLGLNANGNRLYAVLADHDLAVVFDIQAHGLLARLN